MDPIIICGDIHGDSFWKNGLDYFYSHPECKFIFLGDYLDPYSYEGVTPEDAKKNFENLEETSGKVDIAYKLMKINELEEKLRIEKTQLQVAKKRLEGVVKNASN